MFVHPTNTAVILDLKGFLINQKLFLSTSEYQYYCQGRKWNMPDFWNRHNHSLSKVYRFIFLYLFIISILISSNAYTCARFNEHSVLLIVTCSNKGFDLIWFEAAAFPFNKLFFAPSRFSLLSSRWLPCMPSPICSKSFKKKTSSTKNYLHLERNTKHWVDWRLRS